jgi:hypothetical protein
VRPRASGRLAGGTRLLLAVLLVLLASACRLDLHLDLTLDRDGGGEIGVTVAADEGLQSRAEAAGADPLGELAARGRELEAAGWQVTEEELPEGGAQVRLSARFADGEALNALAGDLGGALAAPEVVLLDGLTLAVTEEALTLAGAAGMVPTDAVGELGLDPDTAVAMAREEDAVGYEVRVTLPGEVRETTADRADGRALVWDVAPGEAVEIRAVGERPRQPVWPLVLGGVLGTLAAAVVIARVRRRRT